MVPADAKTRAAVEHAAVEQALAAERALLDPAVRSDLAAAAALIDPEFLEIGQSGVLWNRDTVLAEFALAGTPPAVQLSELRGTILAEDLVLVTYISTIDEQSVRRSSIWRRGAEGWRVLFHQGTRMA